MGDAQKLSPDEQVRSAFEAYENGRDFTVAVEEEFAILDRETLELTNRFEDLQAAAQGTAPRRAPRRRADRVGDRGADRPLRVVRRGGRAHGERRMQLHELAQSHDLALASTGTHPVEPLAGPAHHRHAALPRNDEILGYVVWRNNSFGLHVHVGIRGADRAVAVCNLLRNYLPELLALSASSPFVEGVNTRLHSARTEIFTRTFPRCGVPDPYDGWSGFERYVRFLYDTGSIDEHTQIWWSVRPHLAYPDRRDPHLRRAAGPGRGAVAGGAHLHACCAPGTRARRGRADRAPAEPADRGEPLARDPPRPRRRLHRPRRRATSVRPGRISSG